MFIHAAKSISIGIASIYMQDTSNTLTHAHDPQTAEALIPKVLKPRPKDRRLKLVRPSAAGGTTQPQVSARHAQFCAHSLEVSIECRVEVVRAWDCGSGLRISGCKLFWLNDCTGFGKECKGFTGAISLARLDAAG